MNSLNKERSIGRREEDSATRKQNERYSNLCEVGKIITGEIDLKMLFPLVMDQTNTIMDMQRSSVFLYDEKINELWSLVATGMEEFEIRIPSNSGNAYVGTTRMKNAIGERWTSTASELVTIIASKIGSLSEKSKLYIGDKTRKLIHDKVECISIGKFKFKNISEETSIHHVTKIIFPDSV